MVPIARPVTQKQLEYLVDRFSRQIKWIAGDKDVSEYITEDPNVSPQFFLNQAIISKHKVSFKMLTPSAFVIRLAVAHAYSFNITNFDTNTPNSLFCGYHGWRLPFPNKLNSLKNVYSE